MQMRTRRLARSARLALSVLAVLLLAGACNYPSGNASDGAPTITVRQPANDAVAVLGDGVRVVAHATDDKGIVRVELWTDGQLTSQQPAPSTAGIPSFNAAFIWTPSTAGPHVLQLKAVDTTDQVAASPELNVNVQAAPTPTALPTTVPPTATPLPTVAATAATTAVQEVSITADNDVNVRSGPGTDYSVLGTLTAGQTVKATGRNGDSSWWQIEYTSTGNDRGWVFGKLVTTSGDTGALPVSEAPPTPTPRPTLAATPVPPTATVASVFRADRTAINAGECTTLRWDVDGVLGVYLNGEGVIGHDTRQVCPASTTEYQLKVVRSNGEQTYPLTVEVSGSTGCNGEPVIDHELSATDDNVGVDEPFSLVWSVRNVRGIWLVADREEIPVEGTGSLNGYLAWREFRYGSAGSHTYHFKLQKCDNTFVNGPNVTVTVH